MFFWRSRFVLPTRCTLAAVFLATGFVSALATADPDLPVLTTLRQIRELQHFEAAQQPPVCVQGVVTFTDPEWHSLFLHDGRDGVFVHIPGDVKVAVGQRLEVTGTADVGSTLACVRSSELNLLGDGALPEPHRIDAVAKFNPDWLVQWVELEGDVYTVAKDQTHCYLGLARSGFGVYAILPLLERFGPVERLRGKRLRLRGMLVRTNPSEVGRLELLVPEQGILDGAFPASESAGKSAASSPAADAQQKILPAAVLDWDKRLTFNMRLRGVVDSESDNRRLFVSDESGSVRVELPEEAQSEFPAVARGDVVDVFGKVVRGKSASHLLATRIEIVGKGDPRAPRSVPAAEASAQSGSLISTEGTLQERDSASRTLIFRDGKVVFRVHCSEAAATEVARWANDSRFRITGGCLLDDVPGAAFTIEARELTVLAGLPVDRETRPTEIPVAVGSREASGGVGTIPIEWSIWQWLAGGTVLLSTLAAATVVWLARRRLNEQRQFQLSIHDQLGELSHVARLNLLSEMVGALSHELSQPLTSVTNYANAAELLCQKELPGAPQLNRLLGNIGREAFRAAEIIRRLRNLVQKKTPGREAIQLGDVLTESVELFRAQQVIPAQLVQLDVEPALPAVFADSIQMQQVVLNLLINASEATRDLPEGRIPDIRVSARAEDGAVIVSVKDNGSGIPVDELDAVFDAYFTTKDDGTGLGLAISRTIVAAHGGTIRAERIVPHGTRFSFSLPVSTARAARVG